MRAYLRSLPLGLIALVTLYLCLATYFAVLGPRVPVSGGLGWDGKIYGACAIDLQQCVESGKYSAYSLGRLFPSAVIHGIFSILDMRVGAAQVVLAFALWNLACAWLGVLLWLDCSRRMGFRAATTAFGLSALFVNFAMVRLAFYAPVSTDYTAFFFAMVGLWVYAAGRPSLALVALVPAGLTWPVAAPALASIAVVGQRQGADPETAAYRTHILTGSILPAILALAYCALAAYFLMVVPESMPSGAMQLNRYLLPLAVPLAAAYVFWAGRSILSAQPWRHMRVAWGGLAAAVLVFAIYLVVSRAVTSYAGVPSPMGLSQLARGLTVTGLTFPGVFAVAHVLFLGPWVIALLVLLPHVWATASGRAAQLLPILLVATVFVLLSESRGMTFYLPFVVFALCLTIDHSISTRTSTAFALAALLFSHFWLPMPQAPFGNLLQAPAQIMFMHIGPWMAPTAYLVGLLQLLGAAWLALLLYREAREGRRCAAAAADGASRETIAPASVP